MYYIVQFFSCVKAQISFGYSACLLNNGKREWKKYLDLDIDSSGFDRVCAELEKKNLIRETGLNGCRIRLFPVSSAVDEATKLLEQNLIYDLYR